MPKTPQTKYRLLDGLAQKARDGSLTSVEINLALSVLLEEALAKTAEEFPDLVGVVVQSQEEIETKKVKPDPDGT